MSHTIHTTSLHDSGRPSASTCCLLLHCSHVGATTGAVGAALA